MRNRQSGQAFILVIIILALGALLVGPALRLTSTTLLSSTVTDRKTKELYAADAGQEYVMWMLLYQSYASQFDEDGETKQLELNINGIPVNLTVVMRAVPGVGTNLFSDRFTIKPTKTVSPSIGDTSLRTYTYTIKLENLTLEDQTLDCVYDILPKDFGTGIYQNGSSQIRVDGGDWQSVGDPLAAVYSTQTRLRWPASGNFDSTIGTFASGQEKEIQFQVRGALKNNKTYYNWVVVQPGAVASGPVAAIVTGTGAGVDGAGVIVQKTVTPQLAPPGVETDIYYQITITNLTGNAQNVGVITDYLPPEFYYVGPTSGNLTTGNPSAIYDEFPADSDIWRWKLVWDSIPPADKSIPSGGFKTLSFWARTTPDVSGSYYNEVVVTHSYLQDLAIFTSIGINQENMPAFSWNSGVVIVPAYDSQAVAGDTTINANLALTLGNISVISWVGQ